MAEVLVDTDVFVDHLRGHRPFVPGRNRVSYSVITRAELFAGRNGDDDKIRLLLGPFVEVDVDRGVAELAGNLRRENGITLPDALIAATALDRQLVLITRNTRDFQGIRGLRLRAPV